MNKILVLSPCLMLPNNREYNNKTLKRNFEALQPDGYAVYDQCFNESDFDPRFIYVGHQDKRMGWVASRNGLLEYFYESDYDYAFWIDANSSVSKPTLNDVYTIFEALRNDELKNCDTIFSSLGMWCSQDRIDIKKLPDFNQNVHIIPAKNNKSYNWMHGLIHKNFKKYYNQEFYIDTRCDTNQGIPEDVYFSRLLRSVTNAYVAPTITLNKPDSSKSCDRNDGTGKYSYPPVEFDIVDRYIAESAIKNNYHHVNPVFVRDEIVLPRVAKMKEFVKPYVSRSRDKKVISVADKVTLF